jgi:hypothetical protein
LIFNFILPTIPKYNISNMHVIFVTYTSYEHYHLRTYKFYSKDLDTAENLVKEWLLEEIRHYIFDKTSIKKEELENIFKTMKLNNLIRFIHENSHVHVQTEHYYHE